MNKKKKLLNFYKNFLNYFWLRPENAILATFRAQDLRAVLDNYFKKNGKILDISCGDGVFSFIAAGGELNFKSDAFNSIKNKKRTSKFDAYDFYDPKLKIKIKKKPFYKIETGTDWKKNLLKKAYKLNFYKKLIKHDNSENFKFDSNKYDLVFSNSAYWVKDIQNHIKEMLRVTKSGGHIYLQMKFKDSILKSLIKYKSNINFGKRFYDIIDGGRLETWRGIKTKKEFDKILKSLHHMDVVYYKPLYGDLIGQIWDIGFRPIFKPLYEMTKNLNDKKYILIKREWTEILYNLSKKYIENYKPFEKEAMEYVILLKKK